MSITSANAVLTLSQPILFPTPVQIQGFAVDDIYDMDEVKSVETLMGVDGVLSAGFVFRERVQHIMLQADSASNDFFDTVNMQQEAALDVYQLSGQIQLPGIATKFNQIKGFLTGYKPMPDAKRTLTPRRYEITWEKVFPAPA